MNFFDIKILNSVFPSYFLRPTICMMLICLSILCQLSNAYGQQSKKIKFEHLKIEQGLSHNYVMSMIQDHKGYLWFGTGNGLDKYDGYSFTNYRSNPHDSTSLPKNQVISLFEDKEGIIWVGTAEGICKFDPKTEKFTRLLRSTDNPYAFNYAQSFNEDLEGNLWVAGSFSGELRIVDRKTGKFSKTNYAEMLSGKIEKDLKNQEKLFILQKDREGQLWIGSPYGLHRLNLIKGTPNQPSKIGFTHYRHDPDNDNSLSSNALAGIYQDRKNIIWILTIKGEINSFNPESGKITRYETGLDEPISIFGMLVNAISEDKEGRLWFGTAGGLIMLDKDRKVFKRFLHDPSDPESISNNFINSLTVDKSGIIWASSQDGINKYDPNQKPFILYQHNPSDPYSLSDNKVAEICEDREGIVWIGTMYGGLNALDKRTGKFTHYFHDPENENSLRFNDVGAILEDQDGNLWVGNGGVLSLFNPGRNVFTHIDLDNPPFQYIYTIYEDRKKLLWLGTNNGILSFDRKTLNVQHYPYDANQPDGISDWWALSIFEDSKNNLWIGPGSQALNRLDRKTGKFHHYKFDYQKEGSISSATIPSIFEDSKGNLWFGTGEGGLCRFDYETNSFVIYSQKDGLPGNTVFSILEDNSSNLWLGTNNGLSMFNPAQETFINYDPADGLQSKMFTTLYTEGAAFKGNDGTLYFGGNNGFNAFKPEEIHVNRYIPPVVISQFKLFDKIIPGVHEAKEIELDYDQNFFSIEFAALNYTSALKNLYIYQLEGVDKNWVRAGSGRVASYTNIDPGNYTFKVKGSNNDGIWNEEETSISLIIHPPFWKTWWAYTIYILLLFFVILLASREVVRRERLKANLKINQVESEKLRELDTMKSHFFTNISHEFRTPLSLIQGTVEKLEKCDFEPGRQQHYKMIDRNSNRLLQLINQLLDLSKLDAGKLQLHPEPGDFNKFVTLIAASFSSLFENKKIDFQYHVLQEPLYMKFDHDKLEKILTNLLSNAYKFTNENGQVKLSVSNAKTLNNQCKVTINLSDTGIGIPEDQLLRIFDRFQQVETSATRAYEGTGIGLALVKELVILHKGEITVESVEGSGTNFFIELPLELTTAIPNEALKPEHHQEIFKDVNDEKNDIHKLLQSLPDKNLQLLVVEDNAELRHLLTSELLGEYQIMEVENGLKGYEHAIEFIPDLIISDVMMPVMNGITLCEKLKDDERTSHIPLILLTAKADMESKLQGLETGADDYLTKPFKIEELKLRIRNLMNMRRKLQERFGKQINLDPKEIKVSSTNERFIQKVRSVMEDNLSNADFDVEVFSKEIGMSRAQLHRKLTAISGISANEFIRNFRLKRAACLLSQQKGNISEIAYEVGFSSLNYFTKCFREYYGKTPTQFIRSGSTSEEKVN